MDKGMRTRRHVFVCAVNASSICMSVEGRCAQVYTSSLNIFHTHRYTFQKQSSLGKVYKDMQGEIH